MKDEQWIELTPANGERERAALSFLKSALPDYAPYKTWAGFQFLSLEGPFFDVHALVFSDAGIFLIELATQRGKLEIGARIWRQTLQNKQVKASENPLRRAKLKAESLHRLLEHQTGSKFRIPTIQPIVFVSEQDMQPEIAADAQSNIFFHPDLSSNTNSNNSFNISYSSSSRALPSILAALTECNGPGITHPSSPLNRAVLKRFEQVVEDAGIEPTTRHRRLGDYDLLTVIDTAELYQDYHARHRTTEESVRARIFRPPSSARRNPGDPLLTRIQEAARREFSIVSELKHPSILQARRHIGHELNPAIIFDYPDGAVRLDHYIEQTSSLSTRARFALLESIAEAVGYAHANRVIHRALTPASILVLPVFDNSRPNQTPEIRLHNWHTGAQTDRETGTRHVSDYVHDTAHLFLAPEISFGLKADESADIFGLGTLAFFLFSGAPPARDLPEYQKTLSQQNGFRLTTLRDDISQPLDDLIYDATRVRPDDRIHSVEAFLTQLADASLASIDTTDDLDPINAQPGTVIADRFTVIRRLGSGTTATAFLVKHLVKNDDSDCVLKIANDDSQSSRLLAEANALKKLNHPLIVTFNESFEAGGRTILSIQNAGTTFRDRLREIRALSLDEIRRYGRDLCEICQVLEEQREFHRDIKPANLGISLPGSSRQRLMLFDFSLAGVSIERVDVGTAAYRDPFLTTRRRWDTYADRYSAALVLYEMITQQLPTWGDGRSNPALDSTATLHLAPERFPAAVRDDLRVFFHKALARDVDSRFDNAIEMLAAWDFIFNRTVHTDHGSDELAERLRNAHATTKLAQLGISQIALDALDTSNIITVRDLLAEPASKSNFLTGINNAARVQIRDLRDQLADIFPQLVYGSDQETDLPEPDEAHSKSIDHLLEYVLEKRKGSKLTDLTTLIAQVLSTDDPEHALPWLPTSELAARTNYNPDEFVQKFNEITARWLKNRVLIPLRADLARIIEQSGGIMTATNLSRAVLAERGSVLTGPARLAAAAAVTRAAVEAELLDPSSRFIIRRHTRPAQDIHGSNPTESTETFVATRPALLQILPNLGRIADQFAAEDPLASPERAYEEIVQRMQRTDITPLPFHHALALAAAASNTAALSQRDELYPRGMSARRALTLTASTLLRQAPLDVESLKKTVHERYPQAEALPDRPALDQLLVQAQIALTWDTAQNHGKGAFHFSDPQINDFGISRNTLAHSIYATSTTYQSNHGVDQELQRFEDRLDYRSRNGGFLALMVSPAHANKAPKKLANDYNLEIISIEAVFIKHLKAQTALKKASWNIVLAADAPDASDRDRINFGRLLSQAVFPIVRDDILARRGRILLTDPGLLARWNDQAGTMSLLDSLRDALINNTIDSNNRAELVWLLVTADGQRKRPHIDGAAVPIIDDSEYVRIPSRWLTPKARTHQRQLNPLPL